MASSQAKTVAEYLAELPADKRTAVSAVRAVIRANLPKGYKEAMGSGMIAYVIPLEDYPETYNKQPLVYAALAAQKNYNALYLMSPYSHEPHRLALQDAFKAAGKKLDMGKSCIRFRSAGDLELDVIGRLIASIPPGKWIRIYESVKRK